MHHISLSSIKAFQATQLQLFLVVPASGYLWTVLDWITVNSCLIAALLNGSVSQSVEWTFVACSCVNGPSNFRSPKAKGEFCWDTLCLPRGLCWTDVMVTAADFNAQDNCLGRQEGTSKARVLSEPTETKSDSLTHVIFDHRLLQEKWNGLS